MNRCYTIHQKIFDLQHELKTRDGGARRDRTDDLLRAKQALSQLSYGPVTCPFTP